MKKSWEDYLKSNGNSTFRAAKDCFDNTGEIHQGIPDDHLQEIFDGADRDSDFELAVLAELNDRQVKMG